MPRPSTRSFCSTHYKYVKDVDGLRIVQVGIGTKDRTETHFVQPSEAEAAPPGASRKAVQPVSLC